MKLQMRFEVFKIFCLILNLGLCYVDLGLCSLVMIYTDVTPSGFSVRQSGLYAREKLHTNNAKPQNG